VRRVLGAALAGVPLRSSDPHGRAQRSLHEVMRAKRCAAWRWRRCPRRCGI